MGIKNLLGRVFLFFLVVGSLTCGTMMGQTISGSISGTVVDASGAVIPDQGVTLENSKTKQARSTTTSAEGEFVFTALQPGEYAVKIEKTGFRGFSRTGIILSASERQALGKIQLEVGEVSNLLTVSSEGVATVNTESADTTAGLTINQLDNLVTRGRDVMNLLRILPGVSTIPVVPWGELSENDPAGTNSNGGQFGSFTPAVGGARLFWNTVTVDGQVGSNPDFPGLFMSAISMDAVAEVKIVSNNYTADYGRNPGSTINLVTKSGTQDFHGNLYGYKRHEKLNANDFFNNRDGLQKPIYRFGTLGGNIGGPLFLPNKFNTDKKKLFFFYSTEFWQTKVPQGISRNNVPTEAERNGDFSNTLDQSGSLVPIIDPRTGLQFQNNIIPEDRINKNGQTLLKILPLPNRTDRNVTQGAYNYEWQDNCDIPKNLQTLKIDYRPTNNDSFSFLPRRWRSDTRGRAYGCRVLGYGEALGLFPHHYKYLTDSINVSWTRTFGTNKVNEWSSGFTGEKEQGLPANLFGRTAENYFDPIDRNKRGFTLGQLYPAANVFSILPTMNFYGIPGGFGVGAEDRLPDNQGYERFHVADNFSWIRGAHTLKFGFYLERNWATDGAHAPCFNGCFDFSRDVNNPGNTGWDFSNALTGNFSSYSESNSRLSYQFRNWAVEWFAQDTWKVNSKLTLTYGMRFSWFTPWYLGKGKGAEWVKDRYEPSAVPTLYRPVLDADGNRKALDPSTGQIFPEVYIGGFTKPWNFSGMVVSDDSSYPKGFRKQQPIQPSPRFGFAYDLFGNGKMAIRGGFAIVKSATPSYNTYGWSMVTNAPVQIQPTIYYGNMDTLLQSSGVLYPTGVSAIQQDDPTPSVYRYSLGVQREIGKDFMLDVSYVGNVGRHLIQSYNPNVIPPGARFLPENQDPTTGTALPSSFYRPYPGYGGISTLINAGISSYNALQVALNKRYSAGFSWGISYTWSKTLNMGSSEGEGLSTYLPWRSWNYGPANFDQTQVFVANYVWDLPKLSKRWKHPLVKGIFDDWQFSGVTTLADGLPRNVGFYTTDGADITGGGDGGRPIVVARATLPHGERNFNRWFNTEAFARPPQGSFGNAAPYILRSPGQNNFDLTLMKQFPLWSESKKLQFRVEMYNAFNHTQFGDMDTTAGFDENGQQVNGQFGQVISTRSPRVIQLSVRFTF